MTSTRRASRDPWYRIALLLGAACLATAAMAACATPEAQRSESPSDDPRAEAARLAAEAPLQQKRAVVDELEIRLRNVSADGLQNGEGVETAVRVPFGNPWEMSAQADVWEAEAAVAWTDFDESDLAQRVHRCRLAADSAESAALTALQEIQRARAEILQEWAADLAAANGMNELEEAGLRLELALEQTRNRPAPAVSVAGASLPLLTSPERPLAVESEVVSKQIARGLPDAQRATAEAKLSQARAERASAERIPFLDFGEVSYRAGSGDGADQIQFQLSMLIPFGVEAAGEAERHEMESSSHRLAASARQAEAAQEAVPVLLALQDFEASIPDLVALEASTADAEAVADAWLTDRLGEPEQVAQVFEAIVRARKEVVERRADAARLGCDLLEVTGVSVAEWPRE